MAHRKVQHRTKQAGDEALGMQAGICRRDFLDAALVGVGNLLLSSLSPAEALAQTNSEGGDWDGPGGVGDYRMAHGNSWEVMNASHTIRDGDYDKAPAVTDTGEVFDCVVVGGGLSGLASALFFSQDQLGEKKRTCLVLENHSVFGGAARRNEFDVDGQRLMAPQGATQFPIPLPDGLIDRFYRKVGFNYWEFQYQSWAGPEQAMPLSRTLYLLDAAKPPTSGFFFGKRFGHQPGVWFVDPVGKSLRGAPISEETRNDLLKLWGKAAITGQPPSQPLKYRGDEFSRRLDGMTLEDYLVQEKSVRRETVRTYLSPGVAGGVGLGADVVSAFSQYAWLPAKDFSTETGLQQAAGGLTDLLRHVIKTLIPDAIPGQPTLHDVCRNSIDFQALDRPGNPTRVRLSSVAVRVEHEGGIPYKSDHVLVTYTRGGKVFRLRVSRRGDGRRGMGYEKRCAGFACRPPRGLRPVSLRVFSAGQRGGPQLEIHSQAGNLRRFLVRGFWRGNVGTKGGHLRCGLESRRARFAHGSFVRSTFPLPRPADPNAVPERPRRAAGDFLS